MFYNKAALIKLNYFMNNNFVTVLILKIQLFVSLC